MKKIIVLFFLLSFNYSLIGQSYKSQEMNSKAFKTKYSKKEISEIFSTQHLVNRNELKYDKTDPSDYYELSDGRILLVLGYGNGSGTMYRSEQEYKKIMMEPSIRIDGEHLLSDLIPTAEVFMKQKQSYINSLAEKLDLSGKLDKSLGSLKLIDDIYHHNKPLMSEFFCTDYLYLIAYLGEVYRHETGGDWIFEKSLNNKSFEPFIKTLNGERLNTFQSLFAECYENYEKFSIYSVAIAQLSMQKSTK